MAAKRKKEEEQEEQTSALATQGDAPSFMQTADREAGFEDMRGKDIELPRVKLIQRTSSEVDSGVRPGSLVDHLTGDVLAEPGEALNIHIVLHYPSWIEWRHPDDGGGIIAASLDPKSALAARATRGEVGAKGKPAVTEYHNFIVILPMMGLDYPMMLSFAKTNFKHGKRLLNLARMRNVPIYGGKYSIATVAKTNNDYKWSEIVPSNDGWADEETFDVLKALHEHWKPIMKAGRISATAGLDEEDLQQAEAHVVDDNEDTEY